MRLGARTFAIAAFALAACASSHTSECTQEQVEQSAVILKRMFAVSYPSWLDAYSGITIEYVGSGDWPCPGEAAIDPPIDGEAKPHARIKLYEAYCSQEPTAALGHLLLHYEPLNRKLFLQGGQAQRDAEADANTFGARLQGLGSQ